MQVVLPGSGREIFNDVFKGLDRIRAVGEQGEGLGHLQRLRVQSVLDFQWQVDELALPRGVQEEIPDVTQIPECFFKG